MDPATFINSVQAGVTERGVAGALVLFPIPHEPGDEPYYDQLALFVDPRYAGVNSLSFLVSGVSGTSEYGILDLNNLPETVKVTVTIETPNSAAMTVFQGKAGNSPQPIATEQTALDLGTV